LILFILLFNLPFIINSPGKFTDPSPGQETVCTIQGIEVFFLSFK